MTTASCVHFAVSAECDCLMSLHCSGRWSLRWGFCDTVHDVTLTTALSLNHWHGNNMRSILILQLPSSVVSDFIRPSLSLWNHVYPLLFRDCPFKSLQASTRSSNVINLVSACLSWCLQDGKTIPSMLDWIPPQRLPRVCLFLRIFFAI